MKKIVVAAALLPLAACAPAYDPGADPEQVRFDKCTAKGGSYTSEDTSAGNKWTCALPENPRLKVDWRER